MASKSAKMIYLLSECRVSLAPSVCLMSGNLLTSICWSVSFLKCKNQVDSNYILNSVSPMECCRGCFFTLPWKESTHPHIQHYIVSITVGHFSCLPPAAVNMLYLYQYSKFTLYSRSISGTSI